MDEVQAAAALGGALAVIDLFGYGALSLLRLFAAVSR